MSRLVFGCPNCAQPFQVEAHQAGQQVRCPSCETVVEIPSQSIDTSTPIAQSTADQSPPQQPVAIEKTPAFEAGPEEQEKPKETPQESKSSEPITIQTSSDVQLDADPTAAPNESIDAAEEEIVVADVKFVPHNVDHLLPPRFEAIDPTFFYRQRGRTGHDQVLLPQADGTVVAVSNRIVTVVHDGIEYQLTSSARYKRNMNLIVNAILIAIAIMLVFAIYLVVK